MHLGRAGVEEHRDDLASRVPADDRVVDDDHALSCDLGQRVELQADALLAQLLVGLDERAPDVPVLDQAFAERNLGGAREPDRGGRPRVGDREDEVCLDRRLLGEPLAHPHARGVHLDALEPRVGAGEVEELEDAERALGGGNGLAGVDAVLVDQEQLAAAELALGLGADEVERAGLGGDCPAVVEPTEDERPEAVRVAEGEELPVGERAHGIARPRGGPSRSRPPARAGPGRSRSGRRSARCPSSSRA